MSTYPYDNDYERVQALGKKITLRRLEEVQTGDVVFHGSRWWKVVGERDPEITLDLEIAGPWTTGQPATESLSGAASALVIVAEGGSGLQFSSGVLLDVLWPGCGLIYVKDALRRQLAPSSPEEEENIFGIFALHYDADGDSYYAPVDQEMQPGVASHWILDPSYDLILNWEPVDVADLLKRMQEAGENG